MENIGDQDAIVNGAGSFDECNICDDTAIAAFLNECQSCTSLGKLTELLADHSHEDWFPYAKQLAKQRNIAASELKRLVNHCRADKSRTEKANRVANLRKDAAERRAQNDAETTERVARGALIVCDPGNLHQIADSAIKAIRSRAKDIYQRSGELVKISGVGFKDSSGCTVVDPAIIPLIIPEIQSVLSRAVSWEKHNKQGDLISCDVPKSVAEIVSAAGGCGRPVLRSVAATPYLTLAGDIVQRAGFSEATGIFLHEPVRLVEMPEDPTRDDALNALADIGELLEDFPWSNDVSRSVGLSLVLTLIARPMLSTSPMHAVSAPAAGSGKSYLIDLASMLAHGHTCPVISVGGADEAEQTKHIASMLMTGAPVFNLDNINGELRGDFLCQAITSPEVSPRILGESRCVKITNTATICATGNNIVIRGDLTRRTLVAVLDRQTENPQNYDFQHKPVEIVQRDRGRYVAAVLTVLRAHLQAGFPGAVGLKPLASFEIWSRVVRGALVWLDQADPCAGMSRVTEADPDRAHQGQLQSALIGLGVTGEATAKTLSEIARMRDARVEDDGDTMMFRQQLTEALEPFAKFGNVINTLRFAKKLSAFAGRIVESATIRSSMAHASTKVWWVQDSAKPKGANL
jgi:putative DNA primase/helicase